MPQRLNKIWIHTIWATQNREALISREIERAVYDVIVENFDSHSCPASVVNGMPDHVHGLFLLSPDRSATTVIDDIRSAAKDFLNTVSGSDVPFDWDKEYAVFSISQSLNGKVFEYIKNQKMHHETMSFSEELEELIKLYGF